MQQHGTLFPPSQLLSCGEDCAAELSVTYLRHLMAELEGSTLKAQVASGADLQDEAKVDVNDVALVVQHDVAVVAVLGLQQQHEYGYLWLRAVA